MFDILYAKVFDSNDKIINCGREVCKDLIKYCQAIDPSLDFGDAETGFVNIEVMQVFHKTYKMA